MTAMAPDDAPPDLTPEDAAVLAVLSTSRGAAKSEIASRSGLGWFEVKVALVRLAATGLIYESSPRLWRRR